MNLFFVKTTIYPNPAEDRFFIQFAEPLKISQVEVFAQIGQRVRLVLNPKTTQGKTEIQTKALENGGYVVKIHTTDGRLAVKKLTVNR